MLANELAGSAFPVVISIVKNPNGVICKLSIIVRSGDIFKRRRSNVAVAVVVPCYQGRGRARPRASDRSCVCAGKIVWVGTTERIMGRTMQSLNGT